MRRHLLALAMSVCAISPAAAAPGDVTTWATATATHASNGRVIVFRYAQEFREGFEKSGHPVRVILVWRYASESGMPAVAEREAMDRFEDLLEPAVENEGHSLLTMVSTGENLREWIYYAKSEAQFLRTVNSALARQPRFPIEIHAAPDPGWSTYERFRKGVRE